MGRFYYKYIDKVFIINLISLPSGDKYLRVEIGLQMKLFIQKAASFWDLCTVKSKRPLGEWSSIYENDQVEIFISISELFTSN